VIHVLLSGGKVVAEGEGVDFHHVTPDERLMPQATYDALRAIAAQCACRCEESWTSRGRHSPDCLEHLREEALAALGETP
jgi:hypothetical protein